MARLSNSKLESYKPLSEPYIGCRICGDLNKCKSLYHPPILAPGQEGLKLTVCQSCYSYYRLMKPSHTLTFERLFEFLSSRPRRVRTHHKIPKNSAEFKRKWGLGGLEWSCDDDGTIIGAWDDVVKDYNPKDVSKFVGVRHILMEMTYEDLVQYAQKNFTDQRFIIKVVSSFSS